MRLDPEELDHIADQIYERLREDLATTVCPDEGTIKGLDPHRLYTAEQVAERWSVSKKTVYRNLQRADWNGQGARFRGIDILRYEGVEVRDETDSSPQDSSGEGEQRQRNDRPYEGNLPEI